MAQLVHPYGCDLTCIYSYIGYFHTVLAGSLQIYSQSTTQEWGVVHRVVKVHGVGLVDSLQLFRKPRGYILATGSRFSYKHRFLYPFAPTVDWLLVNRMTRYLCFIPIGLSIRKNSLSLAFFSFFPVAKPRAVYACCNTVIFGSLVKTFSFDQFFVSFEKFFFTEWW